MKYLGENKSEKQILVGFALETDNETQNALIKIKNKNLDAIVLNSLNDKGAGFGHDTNKVTFINKNGLVKKFELKSKIDVSIDIFNELINVFMKNLSLVLINILFFNFSFSQEINGNIIVNSESVNQTNNSVFLNLENSISNFINNSVGQMIIILNLKKLI